MDRLQEASDHLRDVTDLAEKIRELRAELQRTREALRELEDAVSRGDNHLRIAEAALDARALLADEPDTKEGK